MLCPGIFSMFGTCHGGAYHTMRIVKLAVQVKLLPDEATETALRETLRLCNVAANHASRRAFDTGVTGKTSLQRLVYGELKQLGLSAQPHDPRGSQSRRSLCGTEGESSGGELRARRVQTARQSGEHADPVP